MAQFKGKRESSHIEDQRPRDTQGNIVKNYVMPPGWTDMPPGWAAHDAIYNPNDGLVYLGTYGRKYRPEDPQLLADLKKSPQQLAKEISKIRPIESTSDRFNMGVPRRVQEYMR